jgi:DNA topoisomerase-1
MKLVIVESPTKAKTIQHFLPADFVVKSSYGHVRDLPKRELGVEVQNNFQPKYVVPLTVRKRLAEIKGALAKAKSVILATDEDREGEAIAWHLVQALKLKTDTIQRIVFHEITKSAIDDALKNPRDLDMNLVNAQQARRILDRLVGYELSPFLWRKVAKGLSAGRVQSAAMRLIVEREREIQNFKPDEYWTIIALLLKIKNNSEPFETILTQKNGKAIPKLGVKSQEEAQNIIADLTAAQYKVSELLQKDVQRHPAPPFTTSSLQQEAVKKLRFSAKQTMQIAQQLYEGITLNSEGSIGLITYMRTDSLNLAQQAVSEIHNFILQKFGDQYLPPAARVYKTKTKGAQEAHEAIRPTDINRQPDEIKQYLNSYQYKLYNLIWQRTLACQMASAVLSTTTVDVEAKKLSSDNAYLFRANGSQIKFGGFLKIYNGKIQETILPPLTKNEMLELKKLDPLQHFTQPPARYSEATLIKALEDNGIGRPSTYAPIISTIQGRNYTQKDKERKFFPTDIGFVVNDLLVEHFPEIVDLKFTARMEDDLDKIAQGQMEWTPVIREFYDPFKIHLNQKYQEVAKQKPQPEATDKTCPKCGHPVVIRTSRFGKFYACSQFPKCRFTESLENKTAPLNISCPKCREGQILTKRTRRGKIFYACNRYPECDFALWDKPTGEKCAKCGALIAETKKGTVCSNKDCA